MIRLGVEPKRIIASGYAATDSYEGRHWDLTKRQNGIKTRRIYIKLDKIEDLTKTLKVSLDVLYENLRDYHWTIQSSGVRIPVDVAKHLEYLWTK